MGTTVSTTATKTALRTTTSGPKNIVTSRSAKDQALEGEDTSGVMIAVALSGSIFVVVAVIAAVVLVCARGKNAGKGNASYDEDVDTYDVSQKNKVGRFV